MPCLISAPTRSDVKETTRQKETNKKISKNKNFTAKTEDVSLKAQSNNVKMQSDKTLNTQIHYLLNIQKIESFLNETMQQVDKVHEH